jgi:hypothetical protein
VRPCRRALCYAFGHAHLPLLCASFVCLCDSRHRREQLCIRAEACSAGEQNQSAGCLRAGTGFCLGLSIFGTLFMGVMATLLKRDYQCAPRGGGLGVVCVAWTRDLACGGARQGACLRFFPGTYSVCETQVCTTKYLLKLRLPQVPG